MPAEKDKVFICKCFLWKITRSDCRHLLRSKSEEGFMHCDWVPPFLEGKFANPGGFYIWVGYCVRTKMCSGSRKKMCSRIRKGPCRGGWVDGGLHSFTGSSSVSLPDCFASGEGGFSCLLLWCGAHFCKSLKRFSAEEVPKVGSECVHWILLAIK